MKVEFAVLFSKTTVLCLLLLSGILYVTLALYSSGWLSLLHLRPRLRISHEKLENPFFLRHNRTSKSPLLFNETKKAKIIAISSDWYLNRLWIKDGFLDDTYQTLETRDFSCPKKCLYTQKRSMIPAADLVLSSIVDMRNREIVDIPEKRRADQIWVAGIIESPVNVNVKWHLGNNNHRFNWSASYRLDSDIYWPAGHFYPRKKPLDTTKITPTIQDVKNKTRLAAWVVSNCVTHGNRERIVRHLQKHMQIDIYGKCGSSKCPSTGSCRGLIGKHYKFYLAFENSVCMDYATEKFFETFKSDMIPITYGGAAYDKIAPPHSYINMLDYQNITEFVDYIHYLNENPVAYLKYFQWKQDYIVVEAHKVALCNTCVKLHENQGKSKTISDFSEWWTHPPKGKTFSLNGFVPKNSPVCLEHDEIKFV